MTSVTFSGVTKRFAGDVEAVRSLDLRVEDGELLVVVGPSGCGKTTTLRMLAGLEDVSEGTIAIGRRIVNEVGARDRDIAMVFQSYALYPHLDVFGNLAYPLRLARVPKAQREERVRAVASMLQLDELLERKPRALSGGQRQRVAMGRAMVREPKVFLMDEPLSNLDAKLRVDMRSEVAELQQSLGTTMFYVTHDQVEAMTMGHRVAVMRDGVLQQVAAPEELYRRPTNTFVAGFIGSPPMNLLRGVVGAGGSAGATLACGPHRLQVATTGGGALVEGDGVVVGVRPEHVALHGGHADEGTLPAVVRLVELLGSEYLVHVEVDGVELLDTEEQVTASVARRAPRRMLAKLRSDHVDVRVGDRVRLGVQPRHVHVFDAVDGHRV